MTVWSPELDSYMIRPNWRIIKSCSDVSSRYTYVTRLATIDKTVEVSPGTPRGNTLVFQPSISIRSIDVNYQSVSLMALASWTA